MVKRETPRALVVDDEPYIRELYLRVIRSSVAGVEVVSASDGEEGIRRYDEGGPFHLVISDLSMPRQGGLGLLRHVSASGCGAAVALISGTWGTGEREEAARLGAAYILDKPVSLDELKAMVRRHLALE
ncbi:MAG: response regulator [Planctomycetes bacterium]|nr:response regulator [Planctomycetota bacterium]